METRMSDTELAASLDGTETLPIIQNGQNKRAPVSMVVPAGEAYSPPFTFRNKFINGDFRFAERRVGGTWTGTASASNYVCDQWATYQVSASVSVTLSQQPFTAGQTAVPGEPEFFQRVSIPLGGGGDATTGEVPLYQCIEDVRTLAGRKATLSFWAKADANKSVSVEISQSFGSGGSATVRTFVQKLSLTTSWQKFTLTFDVPSISGKTVNTNSSTTYFQVVFWLSAGTNLNSRTGSLGIQTGTFDFALMQIEEGTRATAFEWRPYQVELALCQRYYEKTYDRGVFAGATGTSAVLHMTAHGTVNYLSIIWSYKVPKRVAGIVTIFATASGAAGYITTDGVDKAAVVAGAGQTSSILRITSSAVVVNSFNSCHATCDAAF